MEDNCRRPKSLFGCKTVLQNYYFAAVDINYNPKCPSTFKIVCLKCNFVQSLTSMLSCLIKCMEILELVYIILFSLLFVCHAMPCHTIPYHTYHTIPYHTIPYHTIPYHTIPYHTIPYHTIPYHTIPYHTIPYERSAAALVWY